jgi:TPR repeat protein
MVIIVTVGLLIGLGAGYFFLYSKPPEVTTSETPASPDEKPLRRMANLPAPEQDESVPPEPDYPVDAAVLEQARKALREGIDPAAAVALAAALPDAPERADAAFLLLEYAAENGHADAAFAVACYYDPSDSQPSGTIRKNEATAYEWYETALENGRSDAAQRLEALRALVRQKADQGRWESQQLIKSWESSSGDMP